MRAAVWRSAKRSVGGSLGALDSCCVNHQREEKEVIPEILPIFW